MDVTNDVLNEQEKDDWCSLKPLSIEFDECVSCDASVSVCEMQSVDQVMQDHLACLEDDKQYVEEELIVNKVSVLMLFKDQRREDNTSSSLMWRTTY